MKTHYGTLELAAGETLRDYKIIANKDQHGLVCEAGDGSTYIDNVEIQGGDHGAVIRGSGRIVARRMKVTDSRRVGINIHQSGTPKSRDITISEFEVSGCGYGGVTASGPADSLVIRDGEVWDINLDDGTSADGVTAYDAGNKNVHVERVNVRNVFKHHGIHLSGTNVSIQNCSAIGIGKRYAGFMVGHTVPGNQGTFAQIVGCYGDGGGEGSYGVWAREFTGVEVRGGYLSNWNRGVYLEKCKHVIIDGAVLHPNITAAVHAHESTNVLLGTVVADPNKRLITT